MKIPFLFNSIKERRMAAIVSGGVKGARRQNAKYQRGQAGSTLVLVVVTASVVLIPVCAFLTSLLVAEGHKSRQQTAVEAACMAGANVLPEIVVNDPVFGFVSLTDDPPVGSATVARDGKPLPVTGINTIIATARFGMLVAEKLDSPELRYLARQNAQSALATCKRLADSLAASCLPTSKTPAVNRDGKAVSAYSCAVRAYLNNMPDRVGCSELKQLNLSMGWLEANCDSNVALPLPVECAEVPATGRFGQNYRANTNVAVGDQEFYFTSQSTQTSLVDARRFHAPDGKRLCSILKVEAQQSVHDSEKRASLLHSAVCAQPYVRNDLSCGGRFMLTLPHGVPESIKCLVDFLKGQACRRGGAEVFQAAGGDFPSAPGSQLQSSEAISRENRTVAFTFAQGLFDWLRTTHGRVRVDSLVNLLESDLHKTFRGIDDGASILLSFDKNGNVVATAFRDNPISEQTVQDQQLYIQTFNALQTGRGKWLMKMRDQVYRLGAEAGGMHGGEPMLERSDIRKACADNNPNTVSFGSGASTSDSPTFQGFDWMSEVSSISCLRESFVQGGLSVEFEISSPMADN